MEYSIDNDVDHEFGNWVITLLYLDLWYVILVLMFGP